MAEGPLSGYRVADFGWVMAGPIVGQMMADMGAEVIKVESRKRLDASRKGRPITGQNIAAGDEGNEPELIPMFHSLNRGKLSAAVDFSQPEGAELARRLVATCDVVIENFPPGVLDRYGLSYPHLRAVREDLVMVSLTAAGQTGPLRNLRAYGPTITSLSGFDSLVGYPQGQVLGSIGLTLSDTTCALFAVTAVLAALYHRRRTGKGQHIDLSEVEAIASLLGEPVLDYVYNRRVPGPRGNLHPRYAPHGVFRCAGEDDWIALAAEDDDQWHALVRVMGEPEWALDPRFEDGFSRLRNVAGLHERIGRWTAAFTSDELADRLQAAGVPAAPVLNIAGQFFHPHLVARGDFVEVEHRLAGTEYVYGSPWKFSRSSAVIERGAPLLGEHNDYVWREVVGLSEDEYADLCERRVLW